MFYEIACNTIPTHTFRPYRDISDRYAWNGLDADWREKTLKSADAFADYVFPPMYASDFMEFSRTGNRSNYEDKFFQKRLALDALVLAECVEDKGKYLPKIIDGIFSICEESAWQLPAHNTYIRDTLQLLLPDPKRPLLDLFACETGAILATVYYLLKKRLDLISPLICDRILYELERRIFTPYLSEHFWWMGCGKEPMCNWTVWCTQNVLLAWFLVGKHEQERSTAIFRKACRSIDYFLKDYGDDGCCDEGAEYYRHSGLCLHTCLEVLNAVSADDAFSPLYREKKMRNIAAYIYHMHIAGSYYANFGDCSAVAGRSGIREFLFARSCGLTDMMDFAYREFADGGDTTLLQPLEHNLYYRLQNAFHIRDIRTYCPTLEKDGDLCHFYPSTGLFVMRNDLWYLAANFAHNGENHNHNDTGSVIVYKEGRPVLIDLGVGTYTKQTFSEDRYNIFTMRSDFHNLPTANGTLQQAGKEYCAKIIDVSTDLKDYGICAELSKAYPKDSGLGRYTRNIHPDGKTIRITDRFSFSDSADKNVVLNYITAQKPQLCEDPKDGPITLLISDVAELKITGAGLLDIEEHPLSDPKLCRVWGDKVYRIRLKAFAESVITNVIPK